MHTYTLIVLAPVLALAIVALICAIL